VIWNGGEWEPGLEFDNIMEFRSIHRCWARGISYSSVDGTKIAESIMLYFCSNHTNNKLHPDDQTIDFEVFTGRIRS
jgi:hypothetical protein